MDKESGFFPLLLLLTLAVFTLTGCLGQSDEAAGAERALIVFFNQLSEGEYQAAAESYGGSYEILTNYNPDQDPENHPALWEMACRFNGFQCLKVKEVLEIEMTGEEVYALTVTFETASGEIFQLGPCCGADKNEALQLSDFTFRVARDDSGRFRVLDLPVYVP
jgi:hypothetical protein